MRRFLLGAMSDAERVAVEDRFVADDELFASLTDTEDELVEAYARGELAPDEAAAFKQGLLSVPAIRRRAETLRTLHRVLERAGEAATPEPRRPWLIWGFWRYAAIGAALVLLAGVAWWSLRVEPGAKPLQAGDPRGPAAAPTPAPTLSAPSPTPLVAETDPNNPVPKRPKVEPEPSPAAPSTIATLVLAGGLTRGTGDMPVLELAPEIGLVRVQLTLEASDYTRYRVSLFDAVGRQVWRSGPVPPRGLAVLVGVPARSLRAGDYRIGLEGNNDGQYLNVDNYAFRVRVR